VAEYFYRTPCLGTAILSVTGHIHNGQVQMTNLGLKLGDLSREVSSFRQRFHFVFNFPVTLLKSFGVHSRSLGLGPLDQGHNFLSIQLDIEPKKGSNQFLPLLEYWVDFQFKCQYTQLKLAKKEWNKARDHLKLHKCKNIPVCFWEEGLSKLTLFYFSGIMWYQLRCYDLLFLFPFLEERVVHGEMEWIQIYLESMNFEMVPC
jgi:hypothetical protein